MPLVSLTTVKAQHQGAHTINGKGLAMLLAAMEEITLNFFSWISQLCEPGHGRLAGAMPEPARYCHYLCVLSQPWQLFNFNMLNAGSRGGRTNLEGAPRRQTFACTLTAVLHDNDFFRQWFLYYQDSSCSGEWGETDFFHWRELYFHHTHDVHVDEEQQSEKSSECKQLGKVVCCQPHTLTKNSKTTQLSKVVQQTKFVKSRHQQMKEFFFCYSEFHGSGPIIRRCHLWKLFRFTIFSNVPALKWCRTRRTRQSRDPSCFRRGNWKASGSFHRERRTSADCMQAQHRFPQVASPAEYTSEQWRWRHDLSALTSELLALQSCTKRNAGWETDRGWI